LILEPYFVAFVFCQMSSKMPDGILVNLLNHLSAARQVVSGMSSVVRLPRSHLSRVSSGADHSRENLWRTIALGVCCTVSITIAGRKFRPKNSGVCTMGSRREAGKAATGLLLGKPSVRGCGSAELWLQAHFRASLPTRLPKSKRTTYT
jgi:hypothetical protein